MADPRNRPKAAARNGAVTTRRAAAPGDDFLRYHHACHDAAADAVAEDLGVSVVTAKDLYRDRVVALREAMLRAGGFRTGAEQHGGALPVACR